MSPSEQVLAQLGRQKWAVDTRDAEAPHALFTPPTAPRWSTSGGPDGRTEIARSRGRDEIIGGITAGWDRTAATWYPGAMIHLIGSHVIEPLGDGRMRCRSYASYLALDPAGAPVLKSYGAYDDLWVPDEGEWRLADRETVMYGHSPPSAPSPAGRTVVEKALFPWTGARVPGIAVQRVRQRAQPCVERGRSLRSRLVPQRRLRQRDLLAQPDGGLAECEQVVVVFVADRVVVVASLLILPRVPPRAGRHLYQIAQ